MIRFVARDCHRGSSWLRETTGENSEARRARCSVVQGLGAVCIRVIPHRKRERKLATCGGSFTYCHWVPTGFRLVFVGYSQFGTNTLDRTASEKVPRCPSTLNGNGDKKDTDTASQVPFYRTSTKCFLSIIPIIPRCHRVSCPSSSIRILRLPGTARHWSCIHFDFHSGSGGWPTDKPDRPRSSPQRETIIILTWDKALELLHLYGVVWGLGISSVPACLVVGMSSTRE